jgi:RimJ/RimL family protein N-acetyltransferase
LSTVAVDLRPVVDEDLDQIHAWRNDPDVTRHLSRTSMTRRQVQDWFDSLRSSTGDRAYAIVAHGALIGYALITDVDPLNKKCEAGIILGDRKHRGCGIGPLVARELVFIAFTQLGMHGVLAVASERNPASNRCFERAGFQQEGRLRHANLRDGEYFDLVLLSILDVATG